MQLLTIWLVNSTTSFFNPPPSENSILHWLEKGRATLFCEGRLFRSSETAEKFSTLWVDLTRCAREKDLIWEGREGKLRLNIPHSPSSPSPDFHLGDLIRFRASLRIPHDFKNPGSFRSELHFRSKGIAALGFVSDPRWLFRIPLGESKGIKRVVERVRVEIREAIFQGESSSAKALLASLFLGERGWMKPELADSFRKAGVAHILAISGLHVAMVALLFLVFFRLAFSFPPFSNSVRPLFLYPLFVIVPVWLYVAVASFPISAVRAAVMGSLVLLSLSLRRRLDLLSSLALAAFLILCLSPLALFGASFQLSFGAVLFLILFYPRLRKLREGWPLSGPLVWICDSLLISLITLVAVAPLLLFHFHEVSFLGLIANVVVIPVVNFLVIPLGMVGWYLTGFFGLSVSELWRVVEWFAALTIRIVEAFAARSDAAIFNGAIVPWQIFLFYALLFLWLIRNEIFSLPKKMLSAGVLMLFLLWGGQMGKTGKLKVTFVDVGQGDSAVVQIPGGKVWVIDGGGIRGSDIDIGRQVLAPYLWEEGIRKIDALFLSHPHADHYKGLGYLAKKFQPKILYTNGDEAPELEAEEWRAFLKGVESGKVAIDKVARGSSPVIAGELYLDFLMPGLDGTLPHFDPNNNSVVMRLSFRDVSILFSGDLMEAGEMLLLESRQNLKSTILKVGHHGSDTSTTKAFLEAVNPQFALVPVGAFNRYGMPGKAVLDRLQSRGVATYRTDTDGAVTFETDGKTVEVKTFVK